MDSLNMVGIKGVSRSFGKLVQIEQVWPIV